jgi:hypothetical protein
MILRALGFALLLASHSGAMAAPPCCLEVSPIGCCTPDGTCADGPAAGCALAANPVGAPRATLRLLAADAGLLVPGPGAPASPVDLDAPLPPAFGGGACGFPPALAFSSLRN